MIDLFNGVIVRSCSPNPGVCHHDNNYPDLRTPGSLIAAIDAPCNVAIPEPRAGWDGCEPRADQVRFAAGGGSAIAWIAQIARGTWSLGLAASSTTTDRQPASFWSADGEVILAPVAEWNVVVERTAGASTVRLTAAPDDGYVLDLIDGALRTVVGGDPNQNGAWGAEGSVHGRLISPGDPDGSYLWGRLTATVPGTRMPLANAPLTNADYVALACWIEQLARARDPKPSDAIDYDRCEYARNPADPGL
jgi:hypothetical protein